MSQMAAQTATEAGAMRERGVVTEFTRGGELHVTDDLVDDAPTDYDIPEEDPF